MPDDAVLKARIEGEYAGGPAFTKAETDAQNYQELMRQVALGMKDSLSAALDGMQSDLGGFDESMKRSAQNAERTATVIRNSFSAGLSGKSAEDSASAFADAFGKMEHDAGLWEQSTREKMRSVFNESGKSAAASAAAFEAAFQEPRSLPPLTRKMDELQQATQRVTGAAQHASGGMGILGHVQHELLGGVASLAAGYFTLDFAIETARKGIEQAQEMRDFQAMMVGIEGSTQAATLRLEYFGDAQERTRRTGSDLAAVYAEQLPLALKKGFSRDHFAEITVQLDQIATRIRKLPGETNAAFEQILTGKARDNNPILRALGLDADSVMSGKTSADELLAKMKQLAAEGEAMGDSTASAFAKVKDAIGDAFGEGWNKARDETKSALDEIEREIGKREPFYIHVVRVSGEAASNTSAGLKLVAEDPWRTFKSFLMGGQWGAGAAYVQDFNSISTGELLRRRLFGNSDIMRQARAMYGMGNADQSTSGAAAPTVPPSPPDHPNLISQEELDRRRRLAEALAKEREQREKLLIVARAELEILRAKAQIYSIGGDFDPLVPGNIDLAHRPIHRNSDGSISTVRSMSFGSDMGEVLVPTVGDDNRLLSDDEAMARYDETGKHLGIFRTPEEATAYAQALHEQQEALYAFANAHKDLITSFAEGSDAWEAEIKYQEALDLAAHETDAELRHQKETHAALTKQIAIDSAFAATIKTDILGGMMAKSQGVTDSNPERQRQLQDDFDRAVWLGGIEDQREEKNRQLDQAAAEEELAKWRQAHEQFTRRLSDVFTDFALTGGKNFGELAGRRFAELTSKGFDDIFAGIFGTPGNPNRRVGTDAEGHAVYQDPGALYGRDGKPLSPTAARNAQRAAAIYDAAAIGVGAYGAGRAGEGTRTGATVSGAVTGFEIGSKIPALGVYGGAIGAVAGAVIAFASNYFGEQQRQSEYKFGTPSFDKFGNASFAGNSNINVYEDKEIETKMQETYDKSRNEAVRLMMALKIQPKEDTFGAFSASVQPEASANFMKHLNSWMADYLPTVGINQARIQVREGFGAMGLGKDRFEQLFAQFNKLDPTKITAIFTKLATGLSTINEASKFLDASNGWGQNTSWYQGLMSERKDMNKSFAGGLTDDFSNILTAASYLDDLVGEDQINALADIGDLMTAVRDKEKAEMRAILQLQDQIAAKGQAAIDRYDLMGMVKKDGTPDYARQADFIKAKADEDLRKIFSATNRDQVSESFDDFLARIDSIVQAGYNINPETGEKWRLWAIDQIAIAQAAANSQLEKFGRDAQSANDKFMTQFQPIFDKFKDAVAHTTTPIDDVGDAMGDLIDPTRKFRDQVLNSTIDLGNLSATVADLNDAIGALVEYVGSIPTASSSSASYSGSNFAAAQREARQNAA